MTADPARELVRRRLWRLPPAMLGGPSEAARPKQEIAFLALLPGPSSVAAEPAP